MGIHTESPAEQRSNLLWTAGGFVFLFGVLFGAGMLAHNVEASQAIAEATQQAVSLLHLQSLLGPGFADCAIDIAGQTHHFAQAALQNGTTILNTVGPLIIGDGDTLNLVTEQARIAQQVLSPTDAQVVLQQIADQAQACSR